MTENGDRPLVTFAVFAYNQEEYIREAVEGAFAQTYEPLEIILSDDCSTDRTFEIMQELAADYGGLHDVRVRKNENNLGTLNHVRSVAQIASGLIFVLAAGDDVSCPERTAAIVSAFTSGAMAVYSGYRLIGPAGEHLSDRLEPCLDVRKRLFWLNQYTQEHFVYGATSAYHTALINALKPMFNRPVLGEDMVLNTLLQVCEGQVRFVAEPLVSYRVHADTTSTSKEPGANFHEILNAERLEAKKNSRRADMYRFISDNYPAFNYGGRRSELIDEASLLHAENRCVIKANWYILTPAQKTCFFIVNKESVGRRWMGARILGLQVFATLCFFIKLGLGRRKGNEWKK